MPVAIGNTAQGAQVAELAPNTKRFNKIVVSPSKVQARSIGALIDGQGSGYGDTSISAYLQKLDGTIVATSANNVVVPDGAPAEWRQFNFPGFPGPGPVFDPDEYILGIAADAGQNAHKATARDTGGIVARWGLEEEAGTVAVDDVGGRTGAWVGGNAAAGDPLIGTAGKSGVFDAGKRVEIPYAAAINPAQFTFICSFNATSIDLAGGAPVGANAIVTNSDFVSKGFSLYVNTGGILFLGWGTGTGMQYINLGLTIIPGFSYYTVISYDSTTLTVHVNNTQRYSGLIAFAPSTALPYIIGGVGGGAQPWRGRIDEPMIFNRALPIAESQDIFYGTYRRGRSARIWGDNFATPRINLVPNPRAVNNLDGVGLVTTAIASPNLTRVADAPPIGTTAVSWANASATTGFWMGLVATGTKQGSPVTTGKTYSAGGLHKLQTAGTTGGEQLMLRLVFLDANGVAIQETTSPAQTPVVGTWYWQSATGVAPVGAVSAVVYFRRTNGSTGTVHRGTAAIICEGAVAAPYGDGDQPGWTWDGAANASTSRGPQGVVNMLNRSRAIVGSNRPFAAQGGATLSVDPIAASDGGPAWRCDTFSTQTFDGLGTSGGDRPTGGPGAVYVAVAKVRGTAGHALRLNDPNASPVLNTIFTATGDWQIVASDPFTAGPSGLSGIGIRVSGSKTTTFYTEWFMVLPVASSAAALAVPFIDPNAAGCDWLGTPNASPSIRWQVPEVYDTFIDGPSATLGLPIANPDLLENALSAYLLVDDPRRGGGTPTSGFVLVINNDGISDTFDTDGFAPKRLTDGKV